MIGCAAVAVTAAALSVAVLERSVGAAPHKPRSAQQLRAPAPNPRSRAAARHLSTAQPAVSRVPRLDARLQTAKGGADQNVSVTVRGNAAQATAAVQKLHGRVLAAVSGAVSAVVARSALPTLAGSSGVTSVDQPVRAVETSTSEGVVQSGAAAWQSAAPPMTGAGAKVAIVDGGFADLAAEVAAGNLPAGTTINGDHCANTSLSQHGTAVAEVVHQMAPGAQLFLYCIDDSIGFKQAEQELQAAGVKIVNSSLGFPGDSRGDGTGDVNSSAATVRTARQAGILWIESAGNNGADHWSGTLKDADRDGLVDLDGTAQELDAMLVPGGGQALAIAQWDQWPTSSAPVTLLAFGWQCDSAVECDPNTETPINPDGDGNPIPVVASHPSGTSPVDGIEIPNSSGFLQEWDVAVEIGSGTPAVRYDLSYWGDVSGAYLWGRTAATKARAAAGSITEPASSPYALAVGAADVIDHTLEPYSSQGPTIDGRPKPDISGYDGVSSNLPAFGPRSSTTGFYGTSAAAPHIAGAAALVSAANPAMDAAQLQDFLERRAGTSPASNQTGHGLLTMGPTTGIEPPTGAGYTPLASPVRILDTRTTIGGHHAQLGPQQSATVKVPGLPADATAVAINLTGTSVKQTTFLASYPGGSAWPGTSNLNLTTADSTAAVYAVVTLGPNQTINVRNAAGSVDAIVDLLGYYAPSSSGKYGAVGPTRIVDTRSGLGGHSGVLPRGQAVRYHLPSGSGVPADATSVIVNVTVTGQVATGYVALSPDCSGTSSTVNYLRSGYTRANLTITSLSAGQGFCVYNAGGTPQLIVDLVGFVGPSGTASYVPLTSPVRIADTRTGNGGRHAALGSHSTLALPDAGIFDVPTSAKAMMIGLVGTNPTATSYLEVFPGTTPPASPTSTLNLTAGRLVSNAAVASLSNGTFGIYNAQGSVQTVADLFGYFA